MLKISLPHSVMAPFFSASSRRPVTALMRVDFPHPDRPARSTISPSFNDKSRWLMVSFFLER